MPSPTNEAALEACIECALTGGVSVRGCIANLSVTV
jgi:hypothetical protein